MLGMLAASLLPMISATATLSIPTKHLVEPNPTKFREFDLAVSAIPSVKKVEGLAKLLGAVSSNPSFGKTAGTLQELRARAAYDWTTNNIGYVLTSRSSAEATLVAGSGNCDAHAVLFAALCKAMNVECSKVTGYLRFPFAPGAALAESTKRLAPGQWLVAHAWNAVRIDGKWGLVDTTLGTPQGAVAPDDYFLVDPEVLATDHVPDDPAQALGADVSLPVVAGKPILRPWAWRRSPSTFNLNDLKAKPGSRSSSVIVHLAWKPDMRVAVQTDAGGIQDAALVQPNAADKDTTEIHICSPKGGAVAWLGTGSGSSWCPLAGYPIAGSTPRRLPTLMTKFYDTGATLEAPFERDLPAGKAAEIRLRAPGATRVVAFQGPEVAGMFEQDGDTWVLRTTPSSGPALQIMASYENRNHFQGLLAYEVR